MTDIKITEQMIYYYRSQPGNLLLSDSAIINLINKDIELGKLPKEFSQLGIDAKKNNYKCEISNLFGYGFNVNNNSFLSLEKESSHQNLEKINRTNYIKTDIENIIREKTGNNNYKLEFDEYTEFTTKNGIKIIIDGSAGKPHRLSIFSDKEIIKINYQKTGIEKTFIDKTSNISKILYYDYYGNILRERCYDINNQIEVYNKDYEEIKRAKHIASEIVKDLTNTNFFGFKSIRDSLHQNIEKITEENILYVMEEYYNLTGKVLIETLPDSYTESVNSIFMNKCSKMDKIQDLNSFLKYTPLGSLFETCFKNKERLSEFALNWESYTGRQTFVYDFENSNLEKTEKERYINLIRLDAFDNFTKGSFKPNLFLENVQTKNKYYKSDNIYDIQFGKLYEPIIIRNKTTGIETILDLREKFNNMHNIDRSKLWGIIQSFPPEVLEDMAIETSNVVGHIGNEFKLKNEADGLYYTDDSKIIFNASSLNTCIHELGHAIDYNYEKSIYNKSRTSSNDFSKIFEQEINNYKAKGNQCFIKGENGNSTGLDGYYNYCTFDEQEMFAECYTLLMLGTCNSKDTILKHFPNCLKATENLLNKIRKLADNKRHKQ